MKAFIKLLEKTCLLRNNFSLCLLTILFFVAFQSCQKDNLLNQEFLNGLDMFSTTPLLNSRPILYYEHQKFTRSSGSPLVITHKIENKDFEQFDGNFVLKIQNGSNKNTRVSSAEIRIDGVLVVEPSDFSKDVILITKQICGLTPKSILEVKLNSTPGSFIDLCIEGFLKPGRALVGPEGGSVMSIDGTVELIVPNGALFENKILGVNIIENQYTGKTDIAEICGPAVQLIGYEGTFTAEVELKIHLSTEVASKIDDQHNIAIYQDRPDLNTYLYHESKFNKEDLSLTTSLNHFSIYLVIVNISNLWKPFSKKYNWTILDYPNSTGDYPSNVTESEVNGAVDKAINTWGYYLSKIGYSFEQVYVNSAVEKDILISWVDDLGDADAQGGWSIGLASKVILFNNKTCSWIANEVPRTFKTSPESIRTVTLHEFGHVLGFSHLFKGHCPKETEEPSCFGPAVMAPYFGVRRDYFDLDPIDIDLLQKRYNIPVGFEFYDDFNADLSNWTLYGSPAPRWVASKFGKNGLFDNNGDPSYNSGAISKNEWDLSKGFILESEVYLDFYNLSGCWNSAAIGLSDPIYKWWGGYDPFVYFGYTANGNACWASPAGTFRHAILSGGYMSTTGWESFGDLRTNPIYVDASLNNWQTLKIVMDADKIPRFYFGTTLIYSGQKPIADQVFVQANKIWLGDRSSGSAGKAYHNWVKLE